MSSREKFEAWAKEKGYETYLQKTGCYFFQETHVAWQVWSAAIVSMQSERDQLAAQLADVVAENAELKAANGIALQILNDEETMVTSLWASSVQKVEVNTPATAAFLAEVRASAVEKCAEHLLSNDDIGVDSEYPIIRQFAAQLRQEAK